MRSRSAAVLATLLATAGCVGAPAPPPTPAPIARPLRPPPPSPQPASADWRDWPITPGAWTFRADARGSIAAFGVADAAALFILRCDRGANAVELLRAGEARGTGFIIRTSTVTRALPTQPTGEAPPAIAAVLSPDDRLLDAIGFSRGRFVVEAPPLATLVIPAWPETLRVIEDCRG